MFQHNGKHYEFESVRFEQYPEVTERLHLELAPCSAQTFWDAFCAVVPAEEVEHLISMARVLSPDEILELLEQAR